MAMGFLGAQLKGHDDHEQEEAIEPEGAAQSLHIGKPPQKYRANDETEVANGAIGSHCRTIVLFRHDVGHIG